MMMRLVGHPLQEEWHLSYVQAQVIAPKVLSESRPATQEVAPSRAHAAHCEKVHDLQEELTLPCQRKRLRLGNDVPHGLGNTSAASDPCRSMIQTPFGGSCHVFRGLDDGNDDRG